MSFWAEIGKGILFAICGLALMFAAAAWVSFTTPVGAQAYDNPRLLLGFVGILFGVVGLMRVLRPIAGAVPLIFGASRRK